MGLNRVIGTDRGLPWHLPVDLKRFRALTIGNPIIMGRTTHEQIGKPLPGRPNIVLTRNRNFHRPVIELVHTPQEAISLAQRLGGEIMIVGGGEVYRQFLPLASRLHLTIVEHSPTGTTTFPLDELVGTRWTVRHQEYCAADERNAFAHRYYCLDRDADGQELLALVNTGINEADRRLRLD